MDFEFRVLRIWNFNVNIEFAVFLSNIKRKEIFLVALSNGEIYKICANN